MATSRLIVEQHCACVTTHVVALPGNALKALVLFAALFPLTSLADPEGDVRDAVGVLARGSYAWETTVRQRFNGETTEPRLNPNAPVEVRGTSDPNGYSEITLLPSRELAAPVTAVSRLGDVVGHTPLGWLRRTEMRQAPGPNSDVDFGGKQVRLSRVISVALRVMERQPPSEELLNLIADLKSYRSLEGLVIAELRDRAVETLWGEPQAKRAPEIQGTVIFKITDQGLTEYHLVIAIGFPNSRTKKIAWSMKQWSTRITGIGSTKVEPPAEAVKALEN
ncbi:MAG: hypothetical protein EXS37_03125 [Opitutus sp.]|nr:hypothetical protein [Opitutus sp.]